MIYALNISYNGSNYGGWQYQKHASNTIQGILEIQLAIILKQNIILNVAGRTDKGVHAKEQVAHFYYPHQIDISKFLYSINSLLKNEAIYINNCYEADINFHARYSCLKKEYRYYISNKKNLFFKNYYYLPNFDIDYANVTAEYLLGLHDFSSFRDADCQAKTAIRTLDYFKFETLTIADEPIIAATIEARSFLHHQIRIMIGTIVQLYLQKKPSIEMLVILEAKNRKKAGITAPANGLFLYKLFY